mgnify:CR=1 FL=1
MEELAGFLSSLNKISLISFFITLSLLFYQIYLFKKEIRKKRNKINLPDFKENFYFKEKKPITFIKKDKQDKLFLFSSFFLQRYLIIMILFFVSFFVFIFTLIKKERSHDLRLSQSVINEDKKNFLTGKIKIYNEKWKELTDEELKNLKPGQKIIIGIEKIYNSDIDMARIKVNQGNWDQQDITQSFNPEKNVFYREYQVSTSDSFLKIEAQLHSKTEGWLGD